MVYEFDEGQGAKGGTIGMIEKKKIKKKQKQLYIGPMLYCKAILDCRSCFACCV